MQGKTNLAVSLVLVIGIIAIGIYLLEELYLGPRRMQRQMVENLKEIVTQLTRDIRIAEVAVLSQDPEHTTTTFRFAEINEQGEKIGEPKVYTISGDVAYFDTLVIKFVDTYDPAGDLPLDKQALNTYLQNKAIIFFRRVFSEKQKPEDGFPLDSPGKIPDIYNTDLGKNSFQNQLWKEFWELATDPKLARERGVRAAHGQAVYTKLQKDKYYILERRLTGDLSIRPVDLPAAVR
jgi:hypothetical protein